MSRPLKPSRIVLAPNALRGGPDALAVARELALGIHSVDPAAEVRSLPLADGGDGTVRALARLTQATCLRQQVRGPVGAPVQASFAYVDDVAFIEMAQASGLRCLDERPRPLRSDTRGTGELVLAALDLGVRHITVGAGGSATVDHGAGALVALGARFMDSAGRELEPIPEQLVLAQRVDLSGLDRRLASVGLTVLSDVATPLSRSLVRFGAQKGVNDSSRPVLQQCLERLSALVGNGPQSVRAAWLGAGGGLAGGFACALAAEVLPGAKYIASIAGLEQEIADSHVVVTAEGRFDRGSLDGKLPHVVLRCAQRYGVRGVLVAGACEPRLLPRGATFLPLVPAQDQSDTPLGRLRKAGASVARLARRVAC